MTDDQRPAVEFSRPIAADRVGRGGLTVSIEAAEPERRALARRFGLIALDSLVATCRLRSVAGGMIELQAHFTAKVAQECVVTLDPVAATVEGSVEQRYALDPAVLRSLAPGGDIDLEADDPPEALADGAIDLGEAVVQQLAVTLDPYPRAPGARFEGVVIGDRPGAEGKAGGDATKSARPSSAFAALARPKK
jgi:hypothetical protein